MALPHQNNFCLQNPFSFQGLSGLWEGVAAELLLNPLFKAVWDPAQQRSCIFYSHFTRTVSRRWLSLCRSLLPTSRQPTTDLIHMTAHKLLKHSAFLSTFPFTYAERGSGNFEGIARMTLPAPWPARSSVLESLLSLALPTRNPLPHRRHVGGDIAGLALPLGSAPFDGGLVYLYTLLPFAAFLPF